jgi:MinD superfamily P-loop ATPase
MHGLSIMVALAISFIVGTVLAIVVMEPTDFGPSDLEQTTSIRSRR